MQAKNWSQSHLFNRLYTIWKGHTPPPPNYVKYEARDRELARRQPSPE